MNFNVHHTHDTHGLDRLKKFKHNLFVYNDGVKNRTQICFSNILQAKGDINRRKIELQPNLIRDEFQDITNLTLTLDENDIFIEMIPNTITKWKYCLHFNSMMLFKIPTAQIGSRYTDRTHTNEIDGNTFSFFTIKQVNPGRTINLRARIKNIIASNSQYNKIVNDDVMLDSNMLSRKIQNDILKRTKQKDVLIASTFSNRTGTFNSASDIHFTQPIERNILSTHQENTAMIMNCFHSGELRFNSIKNAFRIIEKLISDKKFLVEKSILARTNMNVMKKKPRLKSINGNTYCSIQIKEEYNMTRANMITPDSTKTFSYKQYVDNVIQTSCKNGMNGMVPSTYGFSNEKENLDLLLRGMNFGSDVSIAINPLKNSLKLDKIGKITKVTADIDQVTLFIHDIDDNFKKKHFQKYDNLYKNHPDRNVAVIIQLFIDNKLIGSEDLKTVIEVGTTNIKPTTSSTARTPTHGNFQSNKSDRLKYFFLNTIEYVCMYDISFDFIFIVYLMI